MYEHEEYNVQIEEINKKKPNRVALKVTAAAMAVALVAGAAGGAVGFYMGSGDQTADSTTPTLNITQTPNVQATSLDNDLDLAPAHDDLLTPAEVYEQTSTPSSPSPPRAVTTNDWGQLSRFCFQRLRLYHH